QEALRYKWIESEKAGRDLGEAAIRRWVQQHWWGYLRARWLEHLHGKRFWVELDRGDFGLLQKKFHDDALLLDRILDRLKTAQANHDIFVWGLDRGMPMPGIRPILEVLDINSRRLAHRFDPQTCPPAHRPSSSLRTPTLPLAMPRRPPRAAACPVLRHS